MSVEPKSAIVLSGIHSRLSLIQKTLEAAGWAVLAYQNPREALDQLRDTPPSAVFCDEALRGATVSGFLAWHRRLAPETPFYLIGKAPDTGANSADRDLKPTAVLDFPVTVDSVPRPSTVVDERPAEDRKSIPLKGSTSLIALADLIDMMGIARQSAVVELGGGMSGQIFLKEGMMEHAVFREVVPPIQGLRALAELITLDDREFQARIYEPPDRPSINLPIASALGEAARVADEQHYHRELLETLKASCPTVTAAATGYPLAATPNLGFGETAQLFDIAKALLEDGRNRLGSSVSALVVGRRSGQLRGGAPRRGVGAGGQRPP